MKEKTAYSRSVLRMISLLALSVTCALIILAGSCSLSSAPGFAGADGRLTLSFPKSTPLFFAYKDGDDPWQEVTDLGSELALDVNDPEGRYSFASIGGFRGRYRGLYFKSTLKDMSQYRLIYDDTTDTTSYDISGSINDQIPFNNIFIRDYFEFVTGDSYSIQFERDSDDMRPVDIVAQGGNSDIHYIVWRNYDLMATQTFDLEWSPSDIADSFDVDASGIYLHPDYRGTNLFFQSNMGTRFGMDANMTEGIFSLNKFPSPIRDATDAYKMETFFTPFRVYSQFWRDPVSTIKLDHIPNDISGATADSDDRFMVEVELNNPYDSGIQGLTQKLWEIEGFVPPNFTFRAFTTMGRMMEPNPTIGIPKDLSDLANFSNSWELIPDNINTMTVYESNMNVRNTYRAGSLDRYHGEFDGGELAYAATFQIDF